MNRTYLAIAALAALLQLPSTSRAQANNPTGIGIAFGLGTTTIEDQDGPDNRFDGRGFGWNLDIEWRFINNLAAGLNVSSLGEDIDTFNGVDTEVEVRGFGFFLRGYLPVTPRLTLFARYGETAYNADVDPGGGTFLFDEAKDFGFGGDYYFNDRFAARLEARWLDGPSQEAGSIATIGLRWQF